MLSSLELRARGRKLEVEQKERVEKLRRQQEKEAALLARQRERELAREEEARLKKLAELEAAAEEERQREADTERNRGVYLAAQLQAIDADENAAIARGIKRNSDKVTLPASMSGILMDQGAAKNGALLFQLRSLVTGAVTHAGVLEFTAPEGVVGLPHKVRECLFGHGGTARGAVDVRYKRLEKGTFVRFQPLSRHFHEEVGDDVRQVLEDALHTHCTLTEGDTLVVPHGDKKYDLRVTHLQPEPAVSVIDTDVEAEVVASVETETLIREWEEEQARNTARLEELRAERERLAAEAVEAALRAAEEQRVAEARAQAEAMAAEAARAEALRAREAALGPEPGPDCGEPTAMCAVRMPDGTRAARRFRLSDSVAQLFEFVDAKGAGGVQGGYQLVTQFPRRVITRPAHLSNGAPPPYTASQPHLLAAGLGQRAELSVRSATFRGQEAALATGGASVEGLQTSLEAQGAVQGQPRTASAPPYPAAAASPMPMEEDTYSSSMQGVINGVGVGGDVGSQQQGAGEGSGPTLGDLGVGQGGQEVFMLEPLEPM